MTMLVGQFSDLHDTRFREIFDDSFGSVDTYYEKIFKPETSEGSYEMYSGISGHGLMQEQNENESGTDDDRIQGYDITFSNRTFTLYANISYENLNDDRFGELKKEAQVLGEACKETPDIDASEAFVRGFLATDSKARPMLAADGIRFFSTLHKKNPKEAATTYSNASATGIVLSDDNLEIGLLALEQQLNMRGRLRKCNADTLVVSPALRKAACIITGSDKRSGTAENDANVYKGFESYYGGKLNVVVWPQLGVAAGGSDTAWFLLDSRKHELLFQWRERPNVLPVEMVKKPLRYQYAAVARWEFGMVDWRGVWGSKGDGAAYSA